MKTTSAGRLPSPYIASSRRRRFTSPVTCGIHCTSRPRYAPCRSRSTIVEKICPLVMKLRRDRSCSSSRSYVPRSMSHSVPSSSTNTSPCRKGFSVPASMFRYPSSLIGATTSPLSLSSFATLEAKIPFPSPLITVPNTATYFVRPRRYPSGIGEKNSVSTLLSACRASRLPAPDPACSLSSTSPASMPSPVASADPCGDRVHSCSRVGNPPPPDPCG